MTVGQQVSERLQVSACYALIGAVFGFIGAALLWEFLYGIGDRVVSDETYINLLQAVRGWGAAAGFCSGFAVRVAPCPRPAIALALLPIGSVLGGMAASGSGWKGSLAAYFGPQALAMLSCGTWAVVQGGRAVFRRPGRSR